MLLEGRYLACLGLVWDLVCDLVLVWDLAWGLDCGLVWDLAWGLVCVLPTDPDLPAEAGFGAEAFWGAGLA